VLREVAVAELLIEVDERIPARQRRLRDGVAIEPQVLVMRRGSGSGRPRSFLE
jgi:hypothetical protein